MKAVDPYAALKYPEFRLLMGYKFFTTVGIQIQSVLVGWQVYELTHDPLSLGLIGLAEIVPNISIALIGGHFADLLNRKRIMMGCLVLLLSINILLGLYANTSSVVFLYLCVGMTGFARGLLAPASFGLMTELVPKKLYINSSAWSSSLWQIAAMIGAGSAGFLYTYMGHGKSYMTVAVFLSLALFCVVLIKYQFVQMKSFSEPIFKSIKEGINFVLSDQRIFGAQLLDMFAVLFGGAVALLPIFANEILRVGPEGLGLLRAAPSLGALLMAIFMTRYPPSVGAGKLLLSSIALFGVSMICFGISTNFYLSLIVLFASGALDNVSVVIRSTIMQTLTPDHMKGRVSSVNQIFIGSSNEIGAFESGVAAKLMGIVPSVIFGGVITLFVVAYAAKKAPKLRNLNLHNT